MKGCFLVPLVFFFGGGAASCLWPPQVHFQQISSLLCALPEVHMYLLAILIGLFSVHRSCIVYHEIFLP